MISQIENILSKAECVKKEYADLFFDDLPIVSIPYFANFETAKVITVGVNPSSGEIRNNKGKYRSNMTSKEIKDELDNYFKRTPHDWFSPWGKALKEIDFSYSDGSAEKSYILHIAYLCITQHLHCTHSRKIFPSVHWELACLTARQLKNLS